MNTDKTNGVAPTPTRDVFAGFLNDNVQKTAITEGVRRMEDIIKGQTAGLTESQFREALG